MQNRYVGDVGDFGKYGLLKALCGADEHGTELRLGVVWYLVPDEEGGDGQHTSYLTRPEKRRHYHPCDEELYDKLFDIVVRRRDRNVAAVRDHALLPKHTEFFDKPLTFNGMPAVGPEARRTRLEHRCEWVQGAIENTKDCALVFVDPDNGLQVKTERQHKRGPKYVFFDELTPFVERGKSVIIYQHIDHSRPAEEQIRQRLLQLEERFGNHTGAFALHYRRGTARAFLTLPSHQHSSMLLSRAKDFLDEKWSALGHFDPDVIQAR